MAELINTISPLPGSENPFTLTTGGTYKGMKAQFDREDKRRMQKLKAMGQAFIKPYEEAIAEGHPVKAVGRGMTDLFLLLSGGAEMEGGKVTEAVGGASRAGDIAESARTAEVADTAAGAKSAPGPVGGATVADPAAATGGKEMPRLAEADRAATEAGAGAQAAVKQGTGGAGGAGNGGGGSGGGGPAGTGDGGGRSPLGRLFPDLSEEEISAAVEQAHTGSELWELPGRHPRVVASGQPPNGARIGLQGNPDDLRVPAAVPRTGMRQVTVGENPNQIAYHENMEFRNTRDSVLDAERNPVMGPDGRPLVSSAPHPRTELRYHTGNPNAPEGSYSKANPTMQRNTQRGSFRKVEKTDPTTGVKTSYWKRDVDLTAGEKAAAGKAKQTTLYRLPNGQWKPLDDMHAAEKAAAHYPAD